MAEITHPEQHHPATTSSAMVLYSNVKDPGSFISTMGKDLAQSLLWGEIHESQGKMIILESMARGITPHKLRERYHLIFGQLSKKTEAVIVDFKTKFGGSLKTLISTADEVKVEASHDGESFVVHWKWEDLLKEPFVYDSKEGVAVDAINRGQTKSLKLKSKYATARSRENMIWLRACDRAIRRVCPQAALDCIDEIDYIDQDNDAVVVEGTKVSPESATDSNLEKLPSPVTTAPVEDAQFTPKHDVSPSSPVVPTVEAAKESESPAPTDRVDVARSLLSRVAQRPGCLPLCQSFAASVQSSCGTLAGLTAKSLESCIDYLAKLDVENPSPNMEEASRFFQESLRRYEPKN